MKFLRNEMTRKDPLWITVGIKLFVKVVVVASAIGLLFMAVIEVANAVTAYKPAETKGELQDRWDALAVKNEQTIALYVEDKTADDKSNGHNRYQADIAKVLATRAVQCPQEYPVVITVPIIVNIPKVVIPTIEGENDEPTTDEEKAALRTAEEAHPKDWDAYLANQRELRKYDDKLEVQVSWYLEEAVKAENHCTAVVVTAEQSSGGSNGDGSGGGGYDTGYSGPLDNVLSEYIDWGGFPVTSPGPEAGPATPTPDPIPTTTAPDTVPAPTPTPAPPVPTPIPEP